MNKAALTNINALVGFLGKIVTTGPGYEQDHVLGLLTLTMIQNVGKYEGRTESHEQLFFACELGTADEGECGGRWNQRLCYP